VKALMMEFFQLAANDRNSRSMNVLAELMWSQQESMHGLHQSSLWSLRVNLSLVMMIRCCSCIASRREFPPNNYTINLDYCSFLFGSCDGEVAQGTVIQALEGCLAILSNVQFINPT
jgi:hypothetical protein